MSHPARRGNFRQRRQAELCAIVLALLVVLNGCGAPNDAVLEETFEHVYPIESDARIAVRAHDGAVVVYGSNGNELRVRAIKKAYSRDRLNHITIDVSRALGSVSITTKFPPQPNWALFDRSGTVDYTITVPATASIPRLDLHAGEVRLDGMRGHETRAHLGDGRIFARNCFTNMDLTLNRGALTLSYDWWEKEKLSARVKVGQGNAWVFLPTEAAFHLLAQAVHGRIVSDLNSVLPSGNSSARNMQIDQAINGGGMGRINIRVSQGNIKIAEANP